MSRPLFVAGIALARHFPESIRVIGEEFEVYLIDLLDPSKAAKELHNKKVDFFVAMPDFFIARYLRVQLDFILRDSSVDHLVAWVSDKPDLPEPARDRLGVCACLNFALPFDRQLQNLLNLRGHCRGTRHIADFGDFVPMPSTIPPLSSLDERIMQLVSMGFRDKEISDSLHYAPQTIRNHVANLMVRFEAHSRTHLSIKWRLYMYQTRLANDRND